MKTILTILIGATMAVISAPAVADPNVNATGFEWVEYTPAQKTELMDRFFHILKVNREKYAVDGGVRALDKFYAAIDQEAVDIKKAEERARIFSAPCITIFVDIITYDQPAPVSAVPGKAPTPAGR